MIKTGDIESYRQYLWTAVRQEYDIALEARKLGRDVTDRVEIPLASDMADRIEELIEIRGIAGEIRELSKTRTREEISIDIARKVAKMYEPQGKVKAVDKAVRVGLAILTEGILVAPLEGIADVTIDRNHDGTDYVSVVYSGPIRGAGGTAQALSVLIADVVRRDLGIGAFHATDDEIERYIEEIQAYNRIKHLQYLPTPDEIRQVILNSPVCIDGEGSEEEEVSGHRDMERIRTNRIRGGMCLVLCEGLIQKSKKVLKHTAKLGLTEWNFLGKKQQTAQGEDSPAPRNSEKFLKDLVAGRPVFSHPGRPGGFRLRYGRSRVNGLAAASINPASMFIVDRFIAIGSQIKVELPGKAAAVTPSDGIDGPMVLLKNGSHVRVRNQNEAETLLPEIEQITDLGEILIAYGDFLENNYRLVPGSFNHDWWKLYLQDAELREKYASSVPNQFEAIALAREKKIPLHPLYDYFWHDLKTSEILELRRSVSSSRLSGTHLILDSRMRNLLIMLGVPFSAGADGLALDEYYPLITSLGLEIQNGAIVQMQRDEKEDDPMKLINSLAGYSILPRSPVRVGSRLGRPEKAGDRKMKPKVHVLFPVENYGDTRRSLKNARKNAQDGYQVEVRVRKCTGCGEESAQPICYLCGAVTENTGRTRKITVDLDQLMERSIERLGIDLPEKLEIKGVKKLMSKDKVSEPIEKGFLRAIHDVSTNKDGTCRYDMSDIPVTHFRAEEIGLPRERLQELGYDPEKEYNEIFPQDVIIPSKSAEYLINVANFIDDLLIRYYGMPPHYLCSRPEDLIGKLVIGLAPHTSGGILGRIIGFSEASGCYAHPFFHAAKRRNCDGDEDSILLLMDGLLNFSREYLPSTRGGLMDAPLVLTVQLNPDEVDKEAMNVDTLWEYPMEFYRAAEERRAPSEIEELMMTMSVRIKKTGTFMGSGFTTGTSDINGGVLVCSYKTIDTMEEKIERQLSLARRLRGVDEDDVAARVLNSHFLPDMYGNFRKFFSQEFRCTKCNTKYRRVPLSGKCLKCGNHNLILTIHKGSVIKYMNETVKISKEFNLPWYLNVRIDNLVRTIKGTFNFDEETQPEPQHDLGSFDDARPQVATVQAERDLDSYQEDDEE
ncbi:MAG: DNA polymerase II large subunit [Thermoplasmataceae archaeon]